MKQIVLEPELAKLLNKFDGMGGVLDYVFLETDIHDSPDQLHRQAALAGIAVIDRNLEQWAASNASKETPIEMFYCVKWDETKLRGERVSFSACWGTDDAMPKRLGKDVWSIPSVDGYKTTFFNPPHGLGGSIVETTNLFASFNSHIFGQHLEQAEIFSWSTDWSNYFDAGHEWWGAFFWTIQPMGSQRFVVIGASSTD